MAGVTFGKYDKELVEKIREYQCKNQITSFTEAVRQLIQLALTVEDARTKKQKPNR